MDKEMAMNYSYMDKSHKHNVKQNKNKNKKPTQKSTHLYQSGFDQGQKPHWLFQQRLFNINNC